MPKKNPLSLQIDLSKFEKATDEEKQQADVMSRSTTFFRDGMRKLMRNPLAVASIVVLALIIATIVVAPAVVPYSYSEIIRVDGKRDRGAKNLGPFEYSENEQKYMEKTGKKLFPHIMGTDSLSRDYFIRVVYGTRISLFVGVFAAILVLIIGVVYGSISGYAGGRVDLIMMRIVDVIYSLPDMLIIILLSVVLNETLTNSKNKLVQSLGSNMISIFIVFGLLYWVSMARLVRGEILTIKNNEYILAAKAVGASSGRIIRKHIIPNCVSVIIITTALQVPSAIFTESFLSFVGIGLSPTTPSWGILANDCRQLVFTNPVQIIWPISAICLTILSLNFVGDGIGEAFQMKTR